FNDVTIRLTLHNDMLIIKIYLHAPSFQENGSCPLENLKSVFTETNIKGIAIFAKSNYSSE
ncbi:MAG: hypothetical protein ACI3ZC_09840, partial [Candidatus Cryptobacteroides sp.]